MKPDSLGFLREPPPSTFNYFWDIAHARGELIELSVEQFHWLLEGIDLAAMRKHPERRYARLGTGQSDPLEVKLKDAVPRVGELNMEVEMLCMERERQERRPLIVRRAST